jgi:hypothetical protein
VLSNFTIDDLMGMSSHMSEQNHIIVALRAENEKLRPQLNPLPSHSPGP